MGADDTQPNRSAATRPQATRNGQGDGVGSGAEGPPQPPRTPIPWLLVIFLLVFGAAMMLGAAGTGYVAGTRERQQYRATQRSDLLKEQFNLGLADLEAGQLLLAQQRFEYILSVDPEYPGAREMLDLALQGLNQPTATPSPTATQVTLTPTPTLSLDSLDGLLEAAKGTNARQDWEGTIEIVLALRRKDPTYRQSDVNQVLFVALRNRGVQKILERRLEQGLFDLALAARVGTLDGQAESWMRSAEYYQYTNSFFGLDWEQAAINFANLCSAGIWDSCFKYAASAEKYGDQLATQALFCEAAQQYQASLGTRDNPGLQPTATFAYEACLTATAGTPTPSPTLGTPTPSGTPETGTPTASPTQTVTQAGPTPTASPTFTLTPEAATTVAPATPTPTLTLSATAGSEATVTP